MKRADLAGAVALELTRLQRVSEVVTPLLAAAREDFKPWHAAAGAKYVADLSTGLENLCRRRYAYLGVRPPGGPESHLRVLEDFLAAEGLGAALRPELADRLTKYLRFRHRFVHGYGHEVAWEMVEEPLRLLPDTVRVLGQIWQRWVEELPEEGS